MKRKIVHIDEDKCNGCGLCVDACHEGALQMVNGKARLVSDIYCDGLGDCLPACPTGAITIEEREAAPFDEEAVKKRMEEMEEKESPAASPLPCGCPGTQARSLARESTPAPHPQQINIRSELRQWPCQLKLVPVNAPYFDNAHLLVAADCTAYAYAGIHQDFMRNRITLIGCPKLDMVDYTDKLTAILENHEIKSITVLRMTVPCCSGIANAVRNALQKSGKIIPWQVVTISPDGNIIEE